MKYSISNAFFAILNEVALLKIGGNFGIYKSRYYEPNSYSAKEKFRFNECVILSAQEASEISYDKNLIKKYHGKSVVIDFGGDL